MTTKLTIAQHRLVVDLDRHVSASMCGCRYFVETFEASCMCAMSLTCFACVIDTIFFGKSEYILLAQQLSGLVVISFDNQAALSLFA